MCVIRLGCSAREPGKLDSQWAVITWAKILSGYTKSVRWPMTSSFCGETLLPDGPFSLASFNNQAKARALILSPASACLSL
jgi:hypothetical protein